MMEWRGAWKDSALADQLGDAVIEFADAEHETDTKWDAIYEAAERLMATVEEDVIAACAKIADEFAEFDVAAAIRARGETKT
jgi:hypothetical protein